jgi:hypothetical protein
LFELGDERRHLLHRLVVVDNQLVVLDQRFQAGGTRCAWSASEDFRPISRVGGSRESRCPFFLCMKTINHVFVFKVFVAACLRGQRFAVDFEKQEGIRCTMRARSRTHRRQLRGFDGLRPDRPHLLERD